DAHEIRRLAALERRPGPRVVPPLGLLDLEDLGPHVGQQERAVGAGQHPREVDDPDALQRSHTPSLPPDPRASRLTALRAQAATRWVARMPPRRQNMRARSPRLSIEK